MFAHNAKAIDVIYDAECPLCRTYCHNLKASDNVKLTLVNARSDNDLVKAVSKQGYDLDKGMVVSIDGELYHGSAAINELALSVKSKGWVGLCNRLFFNSKLKSKIFYPLSKWVRNSFLRIFDIDDIDNLKPSNTLKKQLGQDWAKLNPAIQNRFAQEPLHGQNITYEGTMHVMRRSFMGWLFACLTKVIGNPLSPYQGENINMDVTLFKKSGRTGVFWQRTYFIPNAKPYVVVSSKQESKEGEMLECLRGGFGMKLHVYVEDEALHFKSYRYFWKVLKYKMPIPHWITPGQTHVIHRDIGNGNFTFTITMTHNQLGETFYQHGIFHLKT